MFKIEPDTKQILVTSEEAIALHEEFERMFVAADTGNFPNMYSMNDVKCRFPKIAEIYGIVCQE